MPFNDFPGDRQPQTSSMILPRMGFVHFIKPLPDKRQVSSRNPGPVIGHAERDRLFRAGEFHLDPALRLRVFERVIKQD